jgi:hypothetical protein
MADLSSALEFELKTRLATARASIQRSRLAFLVLNLASVSVFLIIWNRYFTWYRFFLFPEAPDPNKNWVTAELIRNWIRTQWMPAGTIGVTFGVDDVSVLGALLLLLLSLWLYFTARRENHTTARLLSDVTHIDIPEVRRAVFWALADEHIFLAWARDDRAIGRILLPATDPPVERPDGIVRGALKTVFYSPVLILGLSWTMDLRSLLLPSPFREPGKPLWAALSADERTQAVVVITVAAVLMLFVWHLLLKTSSFNEHTVETLRAFARTAEEIPDPPKQQAPKPFVSFGSKRKKQQKDEAA